MDEVHFVDVSNHQPVIQWDAVAAQPQTYGPIRGVIIKATEATSYVDPYYERHRGDALSVGMEIVGSYHFARPNANAADGADEARHYLAHTDPTDDLLVLDLETTLLPPSTTTAWAHAFVDVLIAERPNVPRLIYTGNFTPFVNAVDLSSKAHLWMAAYPAGYTVDPDPDRLRRPPARPHWERYVAWQYTSAGRVTGIPGNVDRNVAAADWWAAVTGETSTPKPTPPIRPSSSLLVTGADMDTTVIQEPNSERVWLRVPPGVIIPTEKTRTDAETRYDTTAEKPTPQEWRDQVVVNRQVRAALNGDPDAGPSLNPGRPE